MRACFREPIDDIFVAADLLDQAATAHLNNRSDEAETFIRRADIPTITEWTESIWGKANPEIHWRIEQEAPLPFLQKSDRPLPRMPDSATKRLIISRDGYHCRFCGIPVIPAEVRQKLVRLYPAAARWSRRNSEQHAGLQCMWLQFDHIVPNQRGGPSALANVVVTCGPCNFGRMERTIEECGLVHPLDRTDRNCWRGYKRWDGLTRVL
jgi:5-methylcytosine-specific restriction endonuclease McrA